ncbi:hypothetical protein C5167_032827 [Papaver somniferum]|uniref:Uncharacterized protein n=1 Tax=Papaver somniferum TaxID=3469 RepID=A0A4Y7KCK7_PAPSO|nr:hypothetical protein C5167_032827 [Papaver somniferum]
MISKEIEVEIESDSENTESDEEQTKDQKHQIRRNLRNVREKKWKQMKKKVWKLECRTPLHMSKEIMVNFRQGCNNNHHSRLLLAPTTMMVEIMLLKIEVKLLTPHRFSSQIYNIVKFQYQRGNKL